MTLISASYKTDIPAYYGPWLMERLTAGFCRVRNPWGGQLGTVALTPEAVDGFVFWSRNYGPFLPMLDTIAATWPALSFQMTLTAYPRALEPRVIAPDAAIAQLRTLRTRFGPRAAVWRYDPILLSTLTPPAWHRATVARLAAALSGITDEMCLSFTHIYRKSRRNLDRAARRHGFSWYDPDPAEKRALIADLAGIAADAGIATTLCTQTELAVPGVTMAACIDPLRLSDVAGRPISAARHPNRPGCLCARARDIGAYESCAQGCAYCYAVNDPERARTRLATHDPTAAELGGGQSR